MVWHLDIWWKKVIQKKELQQMQEVNFINYNFLNFYNLRFLNLVVLFVRIAGLKKNCVAGAQEEPRNNTRNQTSAAVSTPCVIDQTCNGSAA